MRDKCDGFFILKGNLLSRITKCVELAHERVKTNFKYQEPEFYSRFFDDSENRPFEVSPGRTKRYIQTST